MNCLLCSSPSYNHEISFWKCSNCELIFKNPKDFPLSGDEKARYETHNNDGQDPGYLKYLDRLFSLTDFKAGRAMDYGCGPSRGLEALVESKGLSNVKVESYDPFFFKGADLSIDYDLIFASESFEHFFKPAEELKRVVGLMRAGATLAVSTELHDGHKMSEWWYVRDPTHVIFFGVRTFEVIAEMYKLELLKLKSPHVLLRKS